MSLSVILSLKTRLLWRIFSTFLLTPPSIWNILSKYSGTRFCYWDILSKELWNFLVICTSCNCISQRTQISLLPFVIFLSYFCRVPYFIKLINSDIFQNKKRKINFVKSGTDKYHIPHQNIYVNIYIYIYMHVLRWPGYRCKRQVNKLFFRYLL